MWKMGSQTVGQENDCFPKASWVEKVGGRNRVFSVWLEFPSNVIRDDEAFGFYFLYFILHLE